MTLTGTGGIGKTRLAVELAGRTAGRNKDGPYFVDLATINDVGVVPAALAGVLGVEVPAHEDVMDRVLAALADKSVVVVIDNCEHLLPGIAELIGEVLASAPGVRVLATSRELLGVAGERVWPVEPLGVPTECPSLEQVQDSESGALFLARLPADVAARSLSVGDVAAVGAICRRLEGIPLGMELAAARTRTVSLPDLAALLDQSIGELGLPRRGELPRHATMRAALDWGFQLLSTATQTALQAMSVFAGGCDLPAFGAVCVDDNGPSALELVDELVRTSFVTVDFTREPTRYRLLEPVRQYARELLDASGGAVHRRRRHLYYYAGLVRSSTQEDLAGFDSNWDDLRPELGNFRASLDFAASDLESVDAGLSLVARLWEMWITDAHLDEGLSRSLSLLSTGAGSVPARTQAMYFAGHIANRVFDRRQAVRLWMQSLDEARAGDDRLGEVRARRVLCWCAMCDGDVPGAMQHIDTAIALACQQSANLLHAYCVMMKAELFIAVGEMDQARTLIQQVLDGPDGSVESVESCTQGVASRLKFEEGDYEAAIASGLRMLSVCESYGFEVRVEAHLLLAEAYCAHDNLDEAAAHLEHAQALCPACPTVWDEQLLVPAVSIALCRGQSSEALRLAERHFAGVDQATNVLLQCRALGVLGHAQLAAARPDLAAETFQRLIVTAAIGPYPVRQADGHEGLAAALTALGHIDEASDHLDTGTAIRQRATSRRVPRAPAEALLTRLENPRAPDASRRS